MDFLKQHKILYSLVSSVLVVSLVVYGFGFYSVQAAEVSTLPADIDCTMEYDADNVYFTVGGRTTSINRHMQVYDSGSIHYRFDSYDDFKASADSTGLDNFSAYLPSVNGGSVGFAVKDSHGTWTYTLASFLPLSVEEYREGVSCPASYWYSPSQDKVYILTGDVYNSYSRAVKSYSSGSFLFTTTNKSCDLYVTCIDCRTDSVVHKLDRFSGCDFYSYGYSWSERSGYPEDLLCFFANHEISGFYEPDTSKVNTPDYYFNYQYIFYRDGKGYTFVDSAQPLIDVTAQGSYAYLTFTDSCNKYIYTSLDGITWDIKTTVSTMYGGTFTQLAYDWLYSKTTVGSVNQYDAELVYTNDDKFGKPVVVWDDINDLEYVINKLPELSKGYLEKEQNGVYNEIIKDTGIVSGISKFLEGFSSSVGSDLGIGNTVSWIYSLFGRDIYTVSDLTLMQIAQDLISNTNWRYSFTDDSGAEHYVSYTTLRGYIYEIDAVLTTLNRNFDYYRDDMDFYFKNLNSSFATLNINLGKFFDSSNTHLSALTDKLGKFPDYTAALKDIASKLDKLPSGGSGTPPVSTPFDDTAILGRLDSLNSLLTELKNLERPDLQTVIKPIKDGFDDIHGDLKYIKTLLTVNTIDNLFDDENDDDTGILKYLKNVATTLQSGVVINDALTVGTETMSGVKLLNGYVQDIYTRFPALAPLVLFPPAVALANTIIRKGRAT